MRQGGFGLVEVMIAMLLGLLLTLVAATMLVAANASYLNTGASTRLDDSGRFALAMLGLALHQAGYDAVSVPAPPGITGLDASSLKATSPGIDAPLASAVNGSDVLSTHFRGSADGAIINCAGFEEAGEHAWSIFYVAEASDGEAELRCKYKGEKNWASDAVVRGVDSFQLLYGLDTDTPPDGIANQYLTATAITLLDAGIAPVDPKSHWRHVVSARVALLLHGEYGSRPPRDLLRRYELFEGEVVDEASLPLPLQRRVRRVFAATYTVRNR
jgi:type IV pilus assembly protein PilW